MTEVKRFIINKIILFFMLATLITVAISLMGSIFDADARFGYDALLTPLKYAGLCVIPTFVTFSRRELSRRAMFVRIVLEFVLIEVIILAIAFTSTVMDTDNPSVVLSLAGSVLVIYVLVRLFHWMKDSSEAKRMMDDLTRFQMQNE